MENRITPDQPGEPETEVPAPGENTSESVSRSEGQENKPTEAVAPHAEQDLRPEEGLPPNPLLRRGLVALQIILLIVLVALLGQRALDRNASSRLFGPVAQANNSVEATQTGLPATLPPFVTPSALPGGILRQIDPQTIIPGRPRSDVITYTVQPGDNLFSIADVFNLEPETLLWGNYETLKDNPEILQPEQVLNVLPVDGTYYQWQPGDNLAQVAAFFKAKAEDIMAYPGNQIDLTTPVTATDAIEPGKWVIIPGGSRPLKDWGPPAISRSNPAVARYYGPGSCGEVYEGAIGAGIFVWPTSDHTISGYTYTGIHPAIDIGGSIGNAVYSADSGVVVYAGWSNFGYGNLVVIDHGNGWQTAYGHLSAIGVGCGQSVSRGIQMASLGSTGNSSGPHLHFEMVYNGAKLNPLDYVQ